MSNQPNQRSDAAAARLARAVASGISAIACLSKTNPMAHSGAREGDDTSQHGIGKTKPMAHSGTSRPLSIRQRAALRLLARGHGTMRVSAKLGVNRHTIARWKADPRFAAELEALMQSLASAAVRLRAGSPQHRWFDSLPAATSRDDSANDLVDEPYES